jgi:hypothetical protein
MTEISSTGGTIVYTATGLIHKGNTDRFDFDADTGNKTGTAGRPTKESVEQGLKFDFSAFLTPVKLTGTPGRVIKFK